MQLKRIDWILEVIGGMLCIALLCMPFIYQDDISSKIPTHFDLYGRPDAYGEKGSIFTLPIVGCGIYLLMFFLTNFINPSLFNYPVKVTMKNKQILARIAVRMFRFLKISLLILFIHLSYHTIYIALGNTIKPEPYSFVIAMSLIFLPIIIMFVMMKRVK